MILRDPARRARYDETGEADSRDSAMTDLIQLFLAACETETTSPVELVREKLRLMRQSVQGEQQQLVARARRLSRLAAKVKVRQGENLLRLAVENQAAALDRKAASATEELARIERMMAILADYDFERGSPKSQYGFGSYAAEMAIAEQVQRDFEKYVFGKNV